MMVVLKEMHASDISEVENTHTKKSFLKIAPGVPHFPYHNFYMACTQHTQRTTTGDKDQLENSAMPH
jgi:hypothetical protein